MELDGCGQEGGGHLAVEGQGPLDQTGRELLHRAREAGQGKVLAQDAAVDGGQGVLVGEADGEHAEVTLEQIQVNYVKQSMIEQISTDS